MKTLSQQKFLQTLPDVLIPHLPQKLQTIQVRQPWRWIIQFHFGETRLHYELSRVARREAWEIGFHFESNDKQLNRFLLNGFRRHLFEIKDTLGESFEAEMWDKGWTKIYEVVPWKGIRLPIRPKLANAWQRSLPACTPSLWICAARLHASNDN
ncbi:MAG: hypothetical protein H6652_19875 [Ardenticatenaceae bacterium]|nr:hypothetical protein [Ardenticatenaceae bacterium]